VYTYSYYYTCKNKILIIKTVRYKQQAIWRQIWLRYQLSRGFRTKIILNTYVNRFSTFRYFDLLMNTVPIEIVTEKLCPLSYTDRMSRWPVHIWIHANTSGSPRKRKLRYLEICGIACVITIVIVRRIKKLSY